MGLTPSKLIYSTHFDISSTVPLSDSPVGVFPERRAHERTMAIADVWDNFGFDPVTGNAMISCAGYAARKHYQFGHQFYPSRFDLYS